MSEFLKDPRPNIEFLKPEFVSKILHEEILSFEKAVNNFNMEKKNTFDTLLDSLKSAVVEAVPGADVKSLGFYVFKCYIVGYLWIFCNRSMPPLV